MNFLESDVSNFYEACWNMDGRQRIRNITLFTAIIFSGYNLWMYFILGDFSVSLMNYSLDIYMILISIYPQACLFFISNILSSIMLLLKIIILFSHRQDFFHLILYMKRNFLELWWPREKNDRLQLKVHFFICFFTFLTMATVASYIFSPIIG